MNNKTILVFGASGGLGSAIVIEALEQGYTVIAGVRNLDKMKIVSENIPQDLKTHLIIETVDVCSMNSLNTLVNKLQSDGLVIHHVLSALGQDVRKPFLQHSEENITSQIMLNLHANILITHTFLPVIQGQKGSSILMIGGFGDGSLALPYYSVDVASRAGLKGFVDSVNREVRHEGIGGSLKYFCPSPADTEAERPYHELWRSMGTKIEAPKNVAKVALKAMTQNRTTTLMGGPLTRFLYCLNKIWPNAANAIYLNQAGRQIKEYLKNV